LKVFFENKGKSFTFLAIHGSQKENSSRDTKEKQKERNLKIKIEKNFGKSDDDDDHMESIQPNRCCC